ncbi:MAG: hypothetical protein Kow0031_26760 [Anaerolineae bacterium]
MQWYLGWRLFFATCLTTALWLAAVTTAQAQVPESPWALNRASLDKQALLAAARPPRWNGNSLTYARVITGGVPVYAAPEDALNGAPPLRLLAQGYVWVTLADPQPRWHNNRAWLAINPGEYVAAEHLAVQPASAFHGRPVAEPRRFAWVVFDAYTAPAPGLLPGDDSRLLTRYATVPVEEEARVGDVVWYRVGEGQWVEQGMLGLVAPKARPEGIGPADKWIEVDLFEQTLAAYEGDRMVYVTLVSSGLPWWETTPGLYRIWIKVRNDKMSGREGYEDYYFLEDVPWSMYFNGEFALHGAYWHDRFGIKHSHGCVNLSPADARWLYQWATPSGDAGWQLATEGNPGTWVWVH